MSDAALALRGEAAAPRSVASRVSIAAIAWRNLWRNKRRTWLTASGIGFAGLLVTAANSLQTGSFEMMVDTTARFFSGHVQIQHPRFLDEPRPGHALTNVATRIDALARDGRFEAIAPRAQAFALLSAVRSGVDSEAPAFGGLVVGVDPQREFAAVRHQPASGRFLRGPGEAYLGMVLAKNLGVAVGDDVAILGSAEGGGVAAMVATVVGTFGTGQADFDRSQMHVPLADFQQAFSMADAAHSIALTLADQTAAHSTAASLDTSTAVGVPWQKLLPDVHQLIELKHQSTYMIYALLVVLVTFSIVNTFLMTTFERTPEFGMLKALGMRPAAVLGMLALEALWMALLGLALTFAVAGPLIGALSVTGISFGDAYAEMTAQFMVPDRLHPSFGYRAALEFSVAVVVLTQLAAAIPAWRLRRLRVVDALRAQE